MNKVTALAHYQESQVSAHQFSSKHVEILKNTTCKGLTQYEFEVFLMTCERTKLDPFMKQIHAVKRKETMTIQTGIDGYRLIAERTHCYAPGPETTYTFRKDGSLESATAYVKKLTTKDGTWHIVSATAYFDEYCQIYTDRQTGDRRPMGLWGTMPKTMLSKCAESVALRKAFPGEMSNVYTKEEMDQADNLDDPMKISLKQASELGLILDNCDPRYKEWVMKKLKKDNNIDHLYDLPLSLHEDLRSGAMKNMQEFVNQSTQEIEVTEVE